ncbi:hypothetical protein N1F78_10385 [Seonamhaeicola sp. MEBiC1930]|uniref:hypothetical protein n=1 Tax=Seonamhaeicola sp. MEBiC01930 TaxID=2976768 RepID=UPI00324E45D8
METKTTIDHKINDTIGAMDSLDPIKVSPFFKDKTMNVLFAEKQIEQNAWSWFTPKIQLATLVCVVFLNVYAFTKLDASTNSYDSELNEFAETYGLLSSTESSIFNLE